MAAEFPPNLDDGERWLPSEIFPDVGVCRRHHHNQQALRPRYQSDIEYLEDLANRLAAFGLLDRALSPFPPPPKPGPNLSPRHEGLMAPRPPLRHAPPPREAGFGYRAAPPPVGTGAYFPGPRAVQPFNPVQSQLDSFCLARARVLERSRARFALPVRPARESTGTGVFLPRVALGNVNGASRRAGVKGEEPKHQHHQQQLQPIRYSAVKKQCEQTLTTEMGLGLPQEWTY